MLKKSLLLLLSIFLFFGCKKENKTTTADIVGKWALVSVDYSGVLHYTSQQYPCLADNFQLINSDHTANAVYTGKDTCFLESPPTRPYSIIGVPGQEQLIYTWSLTGNKFYLRLEDGSLGYGDMTNSNGKLLLTIRDTFKYPTGQTIYTYVYNKN